ncbi:MAG TPA: TonB-dependent receptor [Candidatus Dormibacteraeota bacterium]|nr:TonB-dependent receptor [Candidatus Dormibacteraeota bacterium]
MIRIAARIGFLFKGLRLPDDFNKSKTSPNLGVGGKAQKEFRRFPLLLLSLLLLIFTSHGWAQSSGTIEGVVKDPSGAAVPNATVQIHNPVSHFDVSATTDSEGKFRFTSVPFNPYHLSVTASGFAPYTQDVDLRSVVTVSLGVNLKVASAETSVTVQGEAADLIENDPTAHTDVDRNLFSKMPLESVSSSISSLITFTTPGVAADSNGFMHGLGEHQENAFSVDGQPITDQQSKAFSNQIPLGSVQSLEAVNGIPPAEYGDKTTLIINVTTRSGLNLRPTGSVNASYGSFGTSNAGLDFAAGSEHWGNFLTASGLQSGRFLDPPEFQVIHAKGNSENIFDRVDFQPRIQDTFRLNLNYARSWFQQPNQFDQGAAGQDQRALINTFNIAPAWTHIFNTTAVLNVNAFVRQDRYHYFPSANAFSDLPATLAQNRRLTNLGVRADLSYVKGAHNIKMGAQLQHWLLNEKFSLGITDAAFNAPCLDSTGMPDPSPTPRDPAQCSAAREGDTANDMFLAGLLPFDLTRSGRLLNFNDHTDIKETSMYVQDAIRLGNWSFNLGIRGDLYRGLSSASVAEPRTAAAYNIKKTNTVLRIGYARAIVTPYNENLLVSSSTGLGGLGGPGGGAIPPKPGYRNLFNVGFEQAFGRFLVVTADYYWKYTKPDYDFGVLFSTPLTFPIQWRKAKIDGVAVRVSVPNFHGLALVTVLGTSRDRFFPPGVGGLLFNAAPPPGVFRIDHDQAFQQTTHIQYQWKRTGPWIGFNWRYDSGLVAGAVPFATSNTDVVDLTVLTADQQTQAGLFCGNVFPTLSRPLVSCPAGRYGSTRIDIPAPGTQNPDRNPARIKPRHLFDVAVGDDNLFHGDRYKWSLRFTVINLTNKVALYNFLSTFSGTHFVTPRTETVELGFHF